MSVKTDTGRVGEFFAAYVLEVHGIEAHHADRAGADLWCKVGSRLFTVQVKSACNTTVSNYHTRSRYYTYNTRNRNTDYFCFVALDLRLLLMRPVSGVTVSTIRIAPDEFTESNQQQTIAAVIGSV